jgi:hypothetical protein
MQIHACMKEKKLFEGAARMTRLRASCNAGTWVVCSIAVLDLAEKAGNQNYQWILFASNCPQASHKRLVTLARIQ